ncbi:hypothetical protein D9M68_647620 [compost metagenome]
MDFQVLHVEHHAAIARGLARGAAPAGASLGLAARLRQGNSAFFERGDGFEQLPRIGMPGRAEERLGVGAFDDLAAAHQRHMMGHVLHDREVMRDQQHGHAHFALDVGQQVQHLSLHGDVQRRGRFVGDQQQRLGRKRDGDHDALLLPTGELERIIVDAPLGLGDAHPPQPVDGALARRRAAQGGMRDQGFDDLVAHAHDRVQAGGRLLEDDADAAAAHAAHRAFRQAVQVLAVQVDLPAHDASGVRQQAQQRQRRHALAATGFADQRERLPPGDGQLQALDRMRHAAFAGDVHVQAANLQQRSLVHAVSPGLD